MVTIPTNAIELIHQDEEEVQILKVINVNDPTIKSENENITKTNILTTKDEDYHRETTIRTVEPIPTQEDPSNLKQKEKVRSVNENRQKHKIVSNETHTLKKSEVDTLNIINIAKSKQNHAETALHVNQVHANAPQNEFLTRNEPSSTIIKEQVQSISNNIQNLQNQLQSLIDKAKTQIGPRKNKPSTLNQLKTESLTQINNDSSIESTISAKIANQNIKSHDHTMSCDNSHKKSLGQNTNNCGTRPYDKTRERNHNQLTKPRGNVKTSSELINTANLIKQNHNMEPYLPYEKQWYDALTEREEEIMQEAERRKAWKKIFAAKRQRISAGTEFLNRTSPVDFNDEVSDAIRIQEERLEKQYNQMIKNYYNEDEEKTTFIDNFTVNDDKDQSNYKVNVVINITDIRKNKNPRSRECIIEYKLKKHTASKIYGLGEQYTTNEEEQLQVEDSPTTSAEVAVQSTTKQTITFLTNVRTQKQSDWESPTQSPKNKKRNKHENSTSSESTASNENTPTGKKKQKIIKSEAKSKIAKARKRNEQGRFEKKKVIPTILSQEIRTGKYTIINNNFSTTKQQKICVQASSNADLAGKLQPRENYPVVALQRIPWEGEPPVETSPNLNMAPESTYEVPEQGKSIDETIPDQVKPQDDSQSGSGNQETEESTKEVEETAVAPTDTAIPDDNKTGI
ncbi:uncharacterized protein LOC105200589 [Solenopsis invicta]|uniref:uncharacterized protein LOC105200589 n=1 Tax=Solenopsis invicta TaxID=13686 RepID=UPI00193E976F|nr:uncharacterized protein LOC105200589 [Solenopsis invicta]